MGRVITDYKAITVKTYDDSARAFNEYFKGIGSRVEDIDRAFKLADVSDNPISLEIGCGDGRDAKEIIKRSKNYKGFDISKGLIAIAREALPDVDFEVADMLTYQYPARLDIVFAFASLLHLDKQEVKQVFDNVAKSFNKGGVIYISLKYALHYSHKFKKDQFGERMFYFYNPEIIKDLAGEAFESVYENRQFIGSTEWFEIALKKL